MALVARGSYDLEITGDHCTLNEDKRATAEELAGGYLFVSEAGGVITTWDGNELGPMQVGFDNGKTFDVIVASSDGLATEFSQQLTDRADG